jgi:hypothetical protein
MIGQTLETNIVSLVLAYFDLLFVLARFILVLSLT